MLVFTVGCGSKKSGGVSDVSGDSDDSDDSDGTGGKDGGKDAGKRDGGGSSSSDDSDDDDDDDDDDDTGTPGKLPVDPGSVNFHKDATDGAGLSKDVVDQLKQGGNDCSANIVYPYEDTVFPAGLAPPTVMWDGNTDAAYLKLKYDRIDTVDYQVAVGPSNPGELRIPADDWAAVTARTRNTPLLVTLTTKSGNKISTCEFNWRIAQGAMVGSVFYNTYNLPETAGQGAVMRLTLGQPSAEVYLSYQGPSIPGAGPCVSCHSVSANGSMLAASQHDYTPVLQSFVVADYTISDQPQPAQTSQLPEATFGAFTPDGTRMLTMGNPDCTVGSDSFPRTPNNFPLLVGPSTAALHDARTGAAVDAKGLQDDWYMWMPQFSPKGDKVVFNHAKPGPNGTDRRELAIMDFDEATNTFSNLRVLVSNEGPEPSIDYAPLPTFNPIVAGECTPSGETGVGAIPSGSCTGPCYPAWPFFTPDGEAVVYAMISEPDFTLAFPGRDTPSKSELWYVDVATNEKVRLDNANTGLSPGDSLANYYPTVLPVAIGGYYWIFWTSTRDWGHRDLSADADQIVQGIAGILGGSSTFEATKKRIWVSALRPRQGFEGGLEALTDFSAPAFYLEGQSESGNIRAFATLNPCRKNGNECETGLDCCTGFCDVKPGADKGVCVDEKMCADINEHCETDEDCCPPPPGESSRVCLGNFCGIDILI